MSSMNDPELKLLTQIRHGSTSQTLAHNAINHSHRTAPILTGDAARILGNTVVPQRAVYGRLLSQHIDGVEQLPTTPKLYINSNAPFSAVVCGLQVMSHN